MVKGVVGARTPRPFWRVCEGNMLKLLLVLFVLSVYTVQHIQCAFFLPGITPNDYVEEATLNVFATKLMSERNRIPHDYYKMKFCKPPSARIQSLRESSDNGRMGIGQLLQGERSRLTAYDFKMLRDQTCTIACVSSHSPQDLALLLTRIMKGYRVRLSLDDMPVVVRSDPNMFKLGYPLGAVQVNALDRSTSITVFNHLDFTVRYHVPDELVSMPASRLSGKEKTYRVVGFEVSPKSYARSPCEDGITASNAAKPLVISPSNPLAQIQIPFTYSVKFVESNVKWVTRFDTLLKVSPGRQKIQWFAIVNSFMLAVFLTATLAAVLLRTLRRDCARYGLSTTTLGDDLDDDFESDTGWRMLRGDVFRPPGNSGLLCVLCGSGSQLVLVAFVTLVFALLGILTPHKRGSLLTGLLLFWVLSSGVGGYTAARLHKAMGGIRWKQVTLGVAFMLPGVAFAIFLFINLFMWSVGSIGAAPVLTLLLLLFMWFGISVPLAFVGTYLGYKHKAYDFPVRTNQIPRPIPPQPWFLRAPMVYALCGMLPFGIVCIELRLILNSIWQNEFYHMFAFLFAVFLLLAITCAEVSVVLVFLKLSNSDYTWWWDSWLASASSGAYVFAYSLFYLLTSPGADPKNVVTNILFISYSLLGSLAFSLLTGSIGFLSSLAFTRRIYSASVDD